MAEVGGGVAELLAATTAAAVAGRIPEPKPFTPPLRPGRHRAKGTLQPPFSTTEARSKALLPPKYRIKLS